MVKKRTEEPTAEEVAAQEVAAETRRIDRQRLTWAGIVLAAVIVFGAGYLVGSAGSDDLIASDTSTTQQAGPADAIPPPPGAVGQRADDARPRAFDGRGGPDSRPDDQRPRGGPDGRRGG